MKTLMIGILAIASLAASASSNHPDFDSIFFEGSDPYDSLKSMFKDGKKPQFLINQLYSGRCFTKKSYDEPTSKVGNSAIIFREKNLDTGPLGASLFYIEETFRISSPPNYFDEFAGKNITLSVPQERIEMNAKSFLVRTPGLGEYDGILTEYKQNNGYIISKVKIANEYSAVFNLAARELNIDQDDVWDVGKLIIIDNIGGFMLKFPEYTLVSTPQSTFLLKGDIKIKPLPSDYKFMEHEYCYYFLPKLN